MTKSTSWTLTNSTPATDAPIRVFYMRGDDDATASYRVERLVDGRLIVQVAFGATMPDTASRLYARAHAARLLAMCLDTVADLNRELDLGVAEEDIEIFSNRVEIRGAGAVLASAIFFGETIAEVLFNNYA